MKKKPVQLPNEKDKELKDLYKKPTNWQEDLEFKQFEITTGDCKNWYPKLIANYQMNLEFNGTQYDYIERIGSFFARRLPKGRSYELEFAFTGEKNHEEANAFELSARNANSWIIVHPFYGVLKVQPLNLKRDDSGLDNTTFKCQVLEIKETCKSTVIVVPKEIVLKEIEKSKEFIKIAVNPISASLPVKNIQSALKVTNNLSARSKKLMKLEDEYRNFLGYSKKAISALNNATGITEGYLTYIQSLIDLPAIVTSDIGSRFKCLCDMSSYLISNLKGMATVSYFEKVFFNLIGSIVITSSCKALITQNDGDFKTRSGIYLYITKLTDEYENFLTALYGQEDETFTPDHDLMFGLHSLVCDTSSYLYSIIFSAKQERIFYPPHDTNLILLAHRLYGAATDENIMLIKETNNIGLSEIFNIKKDRPIKYYV